MLLFTRKQLIERGVTWTAEVSLPEKQSCIHTALLSYDPPENWELPKTSEISLFLNKNVEYHGEIFVC